MSPTRIAKSTERDESFRFTHGHALALLSTADIDFINGLRNTVSSKLSDGQGFGGLLQAISLHIDNFERDVRHAEYLDSDRPWPSPLPPDLWGPVMAKRNVLDANTVDISGPGSEDRFEMVLSDPKEALQTVKYLAGIDAACQRLNEIHRRCLQLVQRQLEVTQEQKRLKQPAETTVNDHIRLLRQYNKTKDVGQQLIGLIAENLGVPIGSLYTDQGYGVGADD